MSLPRSPKPVTPLVGILYSSEDHYASSSVELEKLFGPVELESPAYPFTKTAYYDDEMGRGLSRRFLTFEKAVDPEGLVDWKLATNALEVELAKRWNAPMPRPVNLDPGYLTGAKLVLASTKDFAHRIYLRLGIYAEITLAWNSKTGWTPHPFTFPDFRAPEYHEFLTQARERHLRKEVLG